MVRLDLDAMSIKNLPVEVKGFSNAISVMVRWVVNPFANNLIVYYAVLYGIS